MSGGVSGAEGEARWVVRIAAGGRGEPFFDGSLAICVCWSISLSIREEEALQGKMRETEGVAKASDMSTSESKVEGEEGVMGL